MGYNKRRAFLIANKDLAAQLTDLADSDGMAQIRCKDPEAAGKTQFHVNNVLHSMALWSPAKAYVRGKVRTRISTDSLTGDYIVLIGTFANEPMRGSPPKVMNLEALNEAGRYVIADIITQPSWPGIWLKVVAASNDPDVRHIIFKHPPEPAGVRWITDQLDTAGFLLVSSHPDLIFERASASVARVQEGEKP
jgi:hypothetical protein